MIQLINYKMWCTKLILRFASFALFFISINLNAQQQTQFTNILLHQYLYNPAYAGSIKGMQFNAGYRHQWVGFDGAPRVYMASGYGTIKKNPKMAVGGLVINDQSGLINRTSLYGSYSYHLKLNETLKLGFGVSVGYVQYNLKVYNAKPYDKDDGYLSSSILNGNALDANSGFHLYGKKFFLGFSGQQLTKWKLKWYPGSKSALSQHFYAYSGYNFTLDSKKKEYVLQPSVLMRFNSPAPFEIEYNLKLTYRNLVWVGTSFRHARTATNIDKKWQNNSFCGLLGVTISKQFNLGYSYDFGLSNIQKHSSGSHEVIITYTMFSKKGVITDKVQNADEEELNNIDNSIKTNIKSKKK